MFASKETLPVACSLAEVTIAVVQLGRICAICIDAASLLTHEPVIVQLPVTSPPQGATLPQLPLPLLLPHADRIGAIAK